MRVLPPTDGSSTALPSLPRTLIPWLFAVAPAPRPEPHATRTAASSKGEYGAPCPDWPIPRVRQEARGRRGTPRVAVDRHGARAAAAGDMGQAAPGGDAGRTRLGAGVRLRVGRAGQA